MQLLFFAFILYFMTGGVAASIRAGFAYYFSIKDIPNFNYSYY